jgi:hypothetical protein
VHDNVFRPGRETYILLSGQNNCLKIDISTH